MPISGAELTLASRAFRLLRQLAKRPDEVAVLRKRERVRQEIVANLRWPDNGEVPEIVVVKLGKADNYGEPDLRLIGLTASDWFKLEVKGLHDKGLEVFSAIEHVTIRRGKARPTDDSNERKVFIVGRIPYERIDHMDWTPDPGYSAPRFHVSYGWRGPFREVVLYEKGYQDYFFEIPRVTFKPRRIPLHKRLRWNWEARRSYKRGYDS